MYARLSVVLTLVLGFLALILVAALTGNRNDSEGAPDWAVVALTVPLLAMVALVWFEKRLAYRPEWEDRLLERPRPNVTRGVLLCDWVDGSMLSSIASQKRVEPEPVRKEKGEGRTSSGDVEGGRGFRARFSRSKSTDERAYYELPQDPNDLLVRVLERLDDADDATTLLTDIDAQTAVRNALFSGDTLDEIIQAAKLTPELADAREAVLSLQANAVREAKLGEWRDAAQRPRFVLIENAWLAKKGDDEWVLWLRKLRDARYVYSNTPEVPDVLDLPAGMNLSLRLPVAHMTEQGRSRLSDGVEIQAGVLGMTAAFDPTMGHLTVTPVAVFSRIED